jgi:hypothetical protein
MTRLLYYCRGQVFAAGCLLALVVALGLSGCKEWGTHEDGLRDNDLSKTARQARAEKKDPEKDAQCWGWSDKSRQIERDLNGQ